MKYWFWVIIAVFMFLVGVVVGMLSGTYTAIEHLTEAGAGLLSGTTINININETRMAEEINKTVMPTLRYEMRTGWMKE